MAYREDLDMGKITLISLVSLLVTVALLLFLQVLFYGFEQRQLVSPKYNQPNADMTKYVADQQGQLVSIRVVDRQRQVSTIPIQTAMELVVAELRSDPTAAVTGVSDPEQPTVPAQSGETEGSEKADEDAAEDRSEEDDAAAVEKTPEAGNGDSEAKEEEQSDVDS